MAPTPVAPTSGSRFRPGEPEARRSRWRVCRCAPLGSAEVMREREFKFLIPPEKALPLPAELFGDLGRVSVDEFDQDAVYFDTSDLRLTRAGASLRYRSDDGWTVKIPESLGTTTVRDELRFPGGDADEPPAEAVATVRALARSAPLQPVAQISTHRRRLQLEDRRGRPIGELDDDAVRGSAQRSKKTHFRELEFEVADGAEAKAVAKVLKRIHRVGATPDGNRSKISRVLGDPAKAPPDVPPGQMLQHGATVQELARVALATGTRRLVTADPVVRIGKDPEGVHQARVATRRLRSDLRTLRPFLDRSWSEPLRDELRWIGRLLGQVRDADVLGRLLTEHAGTLRPGQHARATSLIRQIEDQRADDRASLLEAMNSTRYLQFARALGRGCSDTADASHRRCQPDHGRRGRSSFDPQAVEAAP